MMNPRVIAVAVSAFLFSNAEAQPDTRFDGIWVGTETVTLQQSKWDRKASRSTNITIAIAQGGTLVGIIGGWCPGRFSHVRRNGDSINFEAGHCKLSVSLSPDGKTLIEKGSDSEVTSRWEVTNSAASYQNFQISGTFHRQ